MAARYLTAVRTVAPWGPYELGGCSLGRAVAFEMARQLEAEGETHQSVVLIDSPLPGTEAGASLHTPLAEVEDQIKEALKQDIITEYIEEMKNGAAIENKGGSAAAPADPAAAGAPAAPAAPAAPKGHSADDGHGH